MIWWSGFSIQTPSSPSPSPSPVPYAPLPSAHLCLSIVTNDKILTRKVSQMQWRYIMRLTCFLHFDDNISIDLCVYVRDENVCINIHTHRLIHICTQSFTHTYTLSDRGT